MSLRHSAQAGRFKARLAARELLVGAFVKTPSRIVAEVLSLTELDCLCLDAEHAPFDRDAIDGCVFAGRASGMDVLVRTPSSNPADVLNALDCGATGVLIPHVRTPEEAAAAVRMTHYGRGGRGYAGSSRAAGYTTRTMAQHLEGSAAHSVVVAQIEDPEAVEAVDAIAQVEGLDALFIGRVDLTVALGRPSQDDPVVLDAVEAVCAAGVRNDKPIGMFLSRVEDVAYWRTRGATLFLLGSDHGFILSGAAELIRRAKDTAA